MSKVKWNFVLVLFLSIMALGTVTGRFAYGQEVVARGDGVVVTSKDISEAIGYLDSLNTGTTPEGYLKFVLEMKLFSAEAEKQGLGEGNETLKDIEDEFKRNRFLATLYLMKLLEKHKISDDVYESFAKTFYVHFQRYNDESGDFELPPMDNDRMRNEIRGKILRSMKRRIRAAEVSRLMKVYNVKTTKSLESDQH